MSSELTVPATIPAPVHSVDAALVHAAIERGSRKARPLAHVVHLEEDIRDYRRAVIGAIALLLAAFLVWASTEPVAETAVSIGQVVPRDSVVKVQHFEGGMVREILVREGARVTAGQPMLRLHPTGFEAEEGQLLARKAALELQIERLRAFAGGRAADFGAQNQLDRFDGLTADQVAILEAETQSLEDRRAVLQSRLDQRLAEQQGLRIEVAAYGREVAALAEERAMYQQLFDQGHGSRINLLRAQRELATVEADRARAQGRLDTVAVGVEEVGMQLIELESTGKVESMTRLGLLTGELAEVQETLARARDRVSRLTVTAPEDGVVKGMTVHGTGEVVQPGQLLLEIVPGDGDLVVESRIATKDVGAVTVGQPVRIKITAFDFARFGAIEGRLEQVSATTFSDDDGQPYYKARIVLNQDWVGKPGNAILPGMVVQADILTGEKTLIEYLLKPIYLAASQAFTER